MLFFVLKDALIGGGYLSFLSDLHNYFSTFRSIRAHSTGNSPRVVSPEVIVESVKSRMALVMSPTSARVGLGLVSIDSSI